jgi:hypothetical protein
MRQTLFLFFLTLALRNYAQENHLDSFFIRSAKFPIETVYLHCDKYEALAGDTIWFKAYVFENNVPSTISTNLYVQLFNSNGHPILEKLFPIFNSLSIGQLSLPDSLKSGNYWIRAFTKYQVNFGTTDLFKTPVAIFNKKGIASVRTKMRVDPGCEPSVTTVDSLLLIATTTDTGLVCHLDADHGCRFLNQQLSIVLASYHQPILKASFSLTDKKPWVDLAFCVKNLHGMADLLLFNHDSLIARQSVNLSYSSLPQVCIMPDTCSGSPGGYNAWTIKIDDPALYNCSVAVVDADKALSQPVSILQHQVADPFDYRQGLQGKFPVIQLEDTAFLSWKGIVKNQAGTRIKNDELVTILSTDPSGASKPEVIPIEANGRFNLKNAFFFDSASISYQLNSFEGDPAAKKIQLSLDNFMPPPFPLQIDSFWKDTLLDRSNLAMMNIDSTIEPGMRIKELPKVTVKADFRKELDDRYTTGIFSELTPYSFDLRMDKTVNSIWAYLRKQLPGFQGGLDIGQLPTFDSKKIIFYVDNEVQSVNDIANFWYEEIAYIKVFPSLWVGDTPFMRWKTRYMGFTLVRSGSGPLKAPVQSDPPVICIYTRKGMDIRTGWAGLNKLKVSGYSSIAKWTGIANDRWTLYWQPLQTGNDFKVRFYNSNAAHFRVCIEGVTNEGKLLHYEQVITAQQ